ncbi:hypothetical protein EVAR_97528_1 [Eumeta japonica]|uniref:Uncharacterized protein n=1 Tax=Eumeta variegata TaxID=151549 RepID=A0A4C1WKU4_EUMVA|nr:hypothetical protein EVAR_97528_1 [Eumeta japonica]
MTTLDKWQESCEKEWLDKEKNRKGWKSFGNVFKIHSTGNVPIAALLFFMVRPRSPLIRLVDLSAHAEVASQRYPIGARRVNCSYVNIGRVSSGVVGRHRARGDVSRWHKQHSSVFGPGLTG